MAAIDLLCHRIGGQQLNESLISASKVALILFDLQDIVGLLATIFSAIDRGQSCASHERGQRAAGSQV
jgi:hypothetical protein